MRTAVEFQDCVLATRIESVSEHRFLLCRDPNLQFAVESK